MTEDADRLPEWVALIDAGTARERYQVANGLGELTVHTHGAQVTGWVSGGRERLWTSATAEYGEGTAIRGGVPVIYPWFANGPTGERTPAHGPARRARWELRGQDTQQGSRAVTLEFGLGGPEEAGRRALEGIPGADGWPAGTSANLAAQMTASTLTVTLTLYNHSGRPIDCEAALHTYFAVEDVEAISIEGLENVGFYDKVAGQQDQQHGPISFGPEIDRVYETTSALTLRDGEHRLQVGQQGGNRTVVWNPGRESGSAMADVSDWRAFVCIEAAAIGVDALVIPAATTKTDDGAREPGSVTLRQEITVLA